MQLSDNWRVRESQTDVVGTLPVMTLCRGDRVFMDTRRKGSTFVDVGRLDRSTQLVVGEILLSINSCTISSSLFLQMIECSTSSRWNELFNNESIAKAVKFNYVVFM